MSQTQSPPEDSEPIPVPLCPIPNAAANKVKIYSNFYPKICYWCSISTPHNSPASICSRYRSSPLPRQLTRSEKSCRACSRPPSGSSSQRRREWERRRNSMYSTINTGQDYGGRQSRADGEAYWGIAGPRGQILERTGVLHQQPLWYLSRDVLSQFINFRAPFTVVSEMYILL